jgi:hypothetical protein
MGGLVGTGVDFYDIHIYSDNGAEIPAASAFNLDKPVYLGEFGENTGEVRTLTLPKRCVY